MSRQRFRKILSDNDVGRTGSHQAGLLIPKSEKALLEFLPELNSTEYNPSVELVFIDQDGESWTLKYIYYNNKLHGLGTRNEYRITRTTQLMRKFSAVSGTELIIEKLSGNNEYKIHFENENSTSSKNNIVKLRGWRREVY